MCESLAMSQALVVVVVVLVMKWLPPVSFLHLLTLLLLHIIHDADG